MHLGHYHGALKNWVRLQSEAPCLFFVADWHALTTHYDDPSIIETSTWEMLIDWLAAGIDPSKAGLFIQSQVPEHAELHLLLSMVDRKSTRLNSSHVKISYAVFCLKKKSLP